MGTTDAFTTALEVDVAFARVERTSLTLTLILILTLPVSQVLSFRSAPKARESLLFAGSATTHVETVASAVSGAKRRPCRTDTPVHPECPIFCKSARVGSGPRILLRAGTSADLTLVRTLQEAFLPRSPGFYQWHMFPEEVPVLRIPQIDDYEILDASCDGGIYQFVGSKLLLCGVVL